MTTIVIVGSRDREIQEFLAATGIQAKSAEASVLSSYGRGLAPPDVIVLDTRSGGGIPPALASLKRQTPALGVVIVAQTLDPALMLEAMRAGFSEFVAEPLTQADLDGAIERVVGQRPSAETGTLFGFVGAKGGVGTTTIAVNMATALARLERGTRTLLIDMHQAGGDAAVFSGVEPRFSILDALENTHRLDRSYLNGLVAPVMPGLDLLASSDRAFGAPVDPAKIRSVLEFTSTAYKYVVLDLPRSDAAVLDALDQLATIFIVANQELATVKSGARMAAMLRERYGRGKLKILLSRSDRQADIGLADVERAIDGEIAFTFPSDYRVALHALNQGRPLALEADSDLAKSFGKLAERLAGRSRAEKPAAARTGLFGRLTPSKRA